MDKKDYRILFMGTPDISAYVLKGMIEYGFNIVGVISQPDKEVGKKRILTATPTKVVALENNIPVYQPIKIRKEYDFVKDINPDLILTLAYGQILPQGLLDIPKYGCLNLHGSLLPKYRGAAPIQYALINNEKLTGMTLMEMTAQMDAGRIYAVKEIKIEEDDNCTSLFSKMGIAALELVKEKLIDYFDNKLVGVEQDESLVTIAPMIKKEDEKLNPNDDIYKVYGFIRALADNIGGYFIYNNQKLKVFKAKIISLDIQGEIGEIIKADKQGIYLQISNGILSLEMLQKEGKQRMDYRAFLNGNQNLLHTKLI